MTAEMTTVENVNTPGKTTRVNTAKYEAMREAYLKVLPSEAPGQTQAELMARVKSELPDALFPAGKTSGWWLKTVQLDLEAKGLVIRENSKPLRWHRA
ncbi:MAG: hypothetical protein AAFN07_11400 [Pseudomonadota bacterium]